MLIVSKMYLHAGFYVLSIRYQYNASCFTDKMYMHLIKKMFLASKVFTFLTEWLCIG